ncbi:MAG: radical SAM family heme chaperone HemW [Desulfobulbaceae bacterium]|nr:radical SAM family heme chaperone HemW [Desulfobulbaceae bacterium]
MQPPLSLYIHLPWCVRKCPYCDFNSYTAGDKAPRSRYLEALKADLSIEAERAGERPLVSVFLGGGTPSLFSPDEIADLLDAVRKQYVLADDIEISMEANPGTVECGDPAGYRRAGVNRLSIGAQSFSAASLAALGRIHSVDDIGRAVRAATAAGFTNINIDLMYALPGQDVAAALFDIDQAAKLEPQHLSWYQLTLEPNTVFHAHPPSGLPDEEASWDIQQHGQQRLTDLGYVQYEVSAYARNDLRSAHNLNYWSFGDYLAVGAGAHGKISNDEGIWRYAKTANPKRYMEQQESRDSEPALKPVAGPDLMFEFLLNVLRLTDGFDERLFRARTGLAGDTLQQRLLPAIKKGLVAAEEGQFWCVTPLGRRFLNDLQAEFLPD